MHRAIAVMLLVVAFVGVLGSQISVGQAQVDRIEEDQLVGESTTLDVAIGELREKEGKSAEDLLRLARLFLRKAKSIASDMEGTDEFEYSLEAYRQCLRQDKMNPEVHYEFSDVLLGNAPRLHWKEAEQILRQGLELAPRNPAKFHVKLGQLYTEILYGTDLSSPTLHKGIQEFEKALETETDVAAKADIWYMIARSLQAKYPALSKSDPDLDKALHYYTKIVEEYPSHPSTKEGLYTAFDLMRKNGESEQIVRYWTKHRAKIRENPEKDYAYWMVVKAYGRALFELGEYQQSLSPLIGLTEKYRDDSSLGELSLMIAECYAHQGERLKAQHWAKRAARHLDAETTMESKEGLRTTGKGDLHELGRLRKRVSAILAE
ncbi:MAG: hypothetical protein WC728_14700 [Elusimicrobiota bacterium]